MENINILSGNQEVRGVANKTTKIINKTIKNPEIKTSMLVRTQFALKPTDLPTVNIAHHFRKIVKILIRQGQDAIIPLQHSPTMNSISAVSDIPKEEEMLRR